MSIINSVKSITDAIKDILPKGTIIEKFLNLPLLFTLIVIFQGSFGSMGVKQQPQALVKLLDNFYARFIFVMAIAFTASGDLEIAALSTFVFFLILHLLRTEEEKKQVKYVI